MPEDRDYWTEDDMIFVHYGMKYGLTAAGVTVCLGPVKVAEKLPDGGDTSPTKPQPVTKPIIEEMVGAKPVTDDVTGKIKVLAGQRLSTRAIAKSLQAEGFSISHMTVHRILSGQRVMV